MACRRGTLLTGSLCASPLLVAPEDRVLRPLPAVLLLASLASWTGCARTSKINATPR